ncbi:hypothetical protein [Klebsiella quasivariicola]|uniref:hypothetical protein n=1 Tax=Klebsiella quasivariicola TaxID=2026240 RepID=UPI001E2C94BC|nr:hypothetical protein [Klebsiella quasivariicola]
MLVFKNQAGGTLTYLGGKLIVFCHPVTSLKEFSLQDSRGGSMTVATHGRMLVFTDVLSRFDSSDGTMMNKTLAERFEELERDYHAVISTKYIGKNVFGHGSQEYIDSAKEGANKQVISSQADSLIKISRIWADFFPANTSNQPI